MKTHLLLPLLLLIASCNDAPLDKEERAGISRDIKQMLISYHEDVKKNGLMAEFKYLDSSDDFFWAPPGYTSALPYDSVYVIISANAPLFFTIDSHWETLKIIPISDNVATYTGKVNSIMIDTSGKTSNAVLLESGTIIKRNEDWKLLSGQTVVIK